VTGFGSSQEGQRKTFLGKSNAPHDCAKRHFRLRTSEVKRGRVTIGRPPPVHLKSGQPWSVLAGRKTSRTQVEGGGDVSNTAAWRLVNGVIVLKGTKMLGRAFSQGTAKPIARLSTSQETAHKWERCWKTCCDPPQGP
jgi:hypothetical protein